MVSEVKKKLYELWCTLTCRCPKCGQPLAKSDAYIPGCFNLEGYGNYYCPDCDGEIYNGQAKKTMRIRLKEHTVCAHDLHEITKYPRPWFKPKPILGAGTILEVTEVWTNFYGSYYRCETKDGIYDIPLDKAIKID